MNTMTSASSRVPAEKKPLTAWAGMQTVLALVALMLGVALAGAALIVASIAVPLGLAMQGVLGRPAPRAARRGWQPVTA